MTAMKLPWVVRAGMIRISTHDLTTWSDVKKMVNILIMGINNQRTKKC